MAVRGTPLSPFVQARLLSLRRQGWTISAAARACDISRPTAYKYLRQTQAARRAA